MFETEIAKPGTPSGNRSVNWSFLFAMRLSCVLLRYHLSSKMKEACSCLPGISREGSLRIGVGNFSHASDNPGSPEIETSVEGLKYSSMRSRGEHRWRHQSSSLQTAEAHVHQHFCYRQDGVERLVRHGILSNVSPLWDARESRWNDAMKPAVGVGSTEYYSTELLVKIVGVWDSLDPPCRFGHFRWGCPYT